MYLKELFSTPVWADSLDFITDQDLAAIRKYCLEQVRVNPSVQYSNQGGYHSPAYAVEQLADTPLAVILQPILDKCNECMFNLGSEKKLRLSSVWFHVNGPDHYNETHAHGGILSGTLYICVPDNESSIFFSRALDMTNYFYGSIGCSQINDITASEFDFKPSERALVIFPSWLPHGVRPNRSNIERISISFNTEINNEQTTI